MPVVSTKLSVIRNEHGVRLSRARVRQANNRASSESGIAADVIRPASRLSRGDAWVEWQRELERRAVGQVFRGP
jgi:hypothetical protein